MRLRARGWRAVGLRAALWVAALVLGFPQAKKKAFSLHSLSYNIDAGA